MKNYLNEIFIIISRYILSRAVLERGRWGFIPARKIVECVNFVVYVYSKYLF